MKKINIDKKIIVYSVALVILFALCGALFFFSGRDGRLNKEKIETQKLEGIVVATNDGLITVKDKNNYVYTFESDKIVADIGMEIQLEYTGLLDKDKEIQDAVIVEYETSKVANEDVIPKEYLDNGIFSNYYDLAYDKLKELSLDEKIGQMLLVRYPTSGQIEALNTYNFGGYLFFERDFINKSKEAVQDMINNVQSGRKIPLLTAVDEEGGKVVRVSSNPNLAESRFASSRDLYNSGGFEKIASDTKEKSRVLKELGLNVNLAPVVDVSTSSSDYMYERALGEDTSITSEFAKTVIEASKGTGVSYTLKHFPGYGNNVDTHVGSATDSRSLEDIKKNDLPPFEAGIKAGAEAVLVSHNIVSSVDPDNPASLSPAIHNLLRDDLKFTGIIITDDLYMGATSSIPDASLKAVKAGNDILITTEYETSVNSIKKGLTNGDITEEQINRAVFRILAWKYYKGLMFENIK